MNYPLVVIGSLPEVLLLHPAPVLLVRRWQPRTSTLLKFPESLSTLSQNYSESLSTLSQNYSESLHKNLVCHVLSFVTVFVYSSLWARYESTKAQGWEFAHSLIAHLLIRSFCSNQMSNCERFTHIAQDKWADVSESLRSLKTNEWPWANRSGRSWQMSNR